MTFSRSIVMIDVFSFTKYIGKGSRRLIITSFLVKTNVSDALNLYNVWILRLSQQASLVKIVKIRKSSAKFISVPKIFLERLLSSFFYTKFELLVTLPIIPYFFPYYINPNILEFQTTRFFRVIMS